MAEVLDPKFLESLRSNVDYGRRLFLHQYMYDYLVFWCEANQVPDKARTLELLYDLKNSGRIIRTHVNSTFEIHCNEAGKIIEVTMLPSGFDVGCVM